MLITEVAIDVVMEARQGALIKLTGALAEIALQPPTVENIDTIRFIARDVLRLTGAPVPETA